MAVSSAAVAGAAVQSASTKSVWNCPPFLRSATVQMSKMSFAIFCLRSIPDFVNKRLFTDSDIFSVILIFSHSEIRSSFEAVNSSSLKVSTSNASNLCLSRLSNSEATRFKTLSVVFDAILAILNDRLVGLLTD